jgi:hypothetical protein
LEIAFKPAQVQSVDTHDFDRRALVAHDPRRSALTAEVLTVAAFKTLTADVLRTLIVHAFKTPTEVEDACTQGAICAIRHAYFKSKVYSDQVKNSKEQGWQLDEPCHTQAQSK